MVATAEINLFHNCVTEKDSLLFYTLSRLVLGQKGILQHSTIVDINYGLLSYAYAVIITVHAKGGLLRTHIANQFKIIDIHKPTVVFGFDGSESKESAVKDAANTLRSICGQILKPGNILLLQCFTFVLTFLMELNTVHERCLSFHSIVPLYDLLLWFK